MVERICLIFVLSFGLCWSLFKHEAATHLAQYYSTYARIMAGGDEVVNLCTTKWGRYQSIVYMRLWETYVRPEKVLVFHCELVTGFSGGVRRCGSLISEGALQQWKK